MNPSVMFSRLLSITLLSVLWVFPLTFAPNAHAQWLDLFSDPVTDFSPPTPPVRAALNEQLDNEVQFWRGQASAWQKRLTQNQAQLQRLQANEVDLQAHILALEGNVHTYRVLQEQKSALPSLSSVPGLADAIASIRLRQFEVTQLQRQMNDTQTTTDRIRMVTVLQDQLQQTFNVGVNLQQTQRELEVISDSLRTSLRDELFWIPSNPVLGISWWIRLPQRLYHQQVGLARTATVQFTWPSLGSRGTLYALILLSLAVFILWARKPLLGHLNALNEPLVRHHQAFVNQAQANHYARAYPTIHDDVEPEGEQAGSAAAQSPALAELPPPVPSPWLTPGVLAIIAVLAAPLSLVLLALGAWIMPADETEYVSVGPVLMALAFSLFVVQFLYRVLKHPDLCPVHFGWSLETQRQLLKFLSRFTWVLLPTTLILATAQQQTVSLTTDSLGVLTLIFASLAIAYLFRRLLRRLPAIHKKVPLYWALNGLLVVLPLVLVVLTATGYYYTSLQLTARLLATFYVLTGWVIAEVTVMRGVELATEKLRRQRAEEIIQFKALTAHESMSAGAMVTPLPTLDLTQVTQQSLRLAQFLILLGFGGLMYWVWADLVGVLAGLNDWALWREVATLDAATDMITLLDIITAIIIVVLTFFFAANLPGLLEMTVLSRLSLQQGSAYAITTLLNYVITATGLVMALSALGVSWDKLQWLVAALSVGLGFGLQEIFANFVSGLIILFERPIRIGDVVTLGNLSGTVSQIRIRATTITEFDRKEIIVPNKTFVTGQLINWSLSDTVTRVIVKLGVAYGSDLDKTRSLLFEAADQNPRVLNDPTPQVLFLNFGASTLDHELRIHVKELGDRNPVIDEINRFVDREFKAAGIEIAFQQIDIRLRNSDGLERVIKQKPSASPPGPLPE